MQTFRAVLYTPLKMDTLEKGTKKEQLRRGHAYAGDTLIERTRLKMGHVCRREGNSYKIKRYFQDTLTEGTRL